jgi:hypothetical protein
MINFVFYFALFSDFCNYFEEIVTIPTRGDFGEIAA